MSEIKTTRPEILAPAGSEEILYAAAYMGADAIYTGAKSFGARAFAKNLSEDEIIRALYRLHMMDKKLYLTVNTLVRDDEMPELLQMLKPLVDAGLDAVIVQDMGVMKAIHECYPTLDIHASTQMAILSADEIELIKKYGVTRVVPARELTIDEIRLMREKTDVEIEVFVHGALCVCYSGWCLMSEHIGGRSGNRGACAGPCRLKYDSKNGEAYYLNAKDSMTLGFIPELVDAGINSFKIEGRMKNKYYAAYMAYLYKHYTDVYIEKGREHFCELKRDPESELNKDIKNALDIYNRGGSFPAFLFAGRSEDTIEKSIKGHRGVPVGEVVSVDKSKNNSKAEIVLTEKVNPKDVLDIIRNGEKIYEFTVANASKKGERISANIGYCDVKSNDEVYRVRNNHLLEKIDDMINDATEASRISAEISVRAKAGELLEMKFTAKEMSVTVSGSEVQKATSKPVTKEDVIKAVGKLNDTGFVPERVEFVPDGDCFFPMKEVKELRRNVLDKWEEEFTKKYKALQRSSQNADYSGLTDIVKQYDDKKLNYNDAENGNGSETDNCFEHDDISSVAINQDEGKKFVSILSLEQLKSDIKKSNKNDILIVRLEGFSEEEIKEYIKIRKSSDKTFAFSLPRPLHGEVLEKVETLVSRILADYGDDGFGDIFVANSLASIAFRNRFFSSTPMYADVNLYMENELAKDVFAGLGIVGVVALDPKQVPVMTTKHRIDATEITTPKRDAFTVVHHGEYGYSSIFVT